MENETLKEMQTRMIKDFMDIIILTELRNGNTLSGYDVIDLIHREFGIVISSGTVYSFLYSMERKGWIQGALRDRSRVYLLTDKGREFIDAILKSKEKIQRFMGVLIESRQSITRTLSP